MQYVCIGPCMLIYIQQHQMVYVPPLLEDSPQVNQNIKKKFGTTVLFIFVHKNLKITLWNRTKQNKLLPLFEFLFLKKKSKIKIRDGVERAEKREMLALFCLSVLTCAHV